MSTPPTPPPGCPAHGLGPDGLRRLYGPEAETDPMGLYEKLRAEHGTVAPVLVHGDLPAWLVLGHRENLDVTRTPSRFTRDPRGWRERREGRVPADHPLNPMTTWVPVCTFVDGTEHQRLRGALTDSLDRFEGRGVRRYVNRFAGQLIDAFESDGHVDLIADFAEPLPMLVMTQLVGMPEESGPRLVEATRDLLKGTETALASNDYVMGALAQLVERRKSVPGHDLTTWFLQHSAGLTDEEIVTHLRVVLVAAFETTANLIASTLRLVLTDRRFRASLSGGHMTLPDALEQVLWDEPPLTAVLARWATGDTTLGGQQIKDGDMLILGLAAGNVDPEIRPDLSTPVHGNRSHLAFSSGPHECPGQDIGRAIADTGIDALLTRLPDLELAVPEPELQWRGTLMSQHLTALPVTFTPCPKGGADRAAQPAQPAPVARPLPAAAAPEPGQPVTVPAPRSGRRERLRSWWGSLFSRR
ncbi:cytochrome P450 [Streptomyces sp. A3M-1-3]|uniref:cytochrome P450 n=1 Tax=Streptomyces sp. A3M-1-3 TaxID=2962044 RepID=UPI0020B87CF5|nr:cytochrome P450 [Streptomyces sp. A3M-1-3]MCP3817757.1 cytochrome P450 [Streptomyces sp. A3M-1-3]